MQFAGNLLECFLGIRIDYHLGNTITIPEVNKRNAAMVPFAVDPSV
jgi:hypothetical protein